MLLARAAPEHGRPVTVANLHASTGPAAGEDVVRAAGIATRWTARDPLVFGGDLNLRIEASPEVFSRLERDYSLRGATPGAALDHILARGLVPLEPARELPPDSREVRLPEGRAIRLSDHPCVVASFEVE